MTTEYVNVADKAITVVNIINRRKAATNSINIFGYFVNDIFVRFTIIKLKYILTVLLVEYLTFI